MDYAIYSLFIALSATLTVANVSARIVSASVNFTLNRKFVFKSRDSVWKSAVKYFLLAAFILVGNTLVLNLLAKRLRINNFAAKIITEVIFYIISWLVQRLFVFKSKTSKEGK